MTRPEKVRFSVREQGFKPFPYPLSNILEFEKEHFSYRKMREITGLCGPAYKFRFAIHPQGIRQFHDNCEIAMCQTIATLAPV